MINNTTKNYNIFSDLLLYSKINTQDFAQDSHYHP